MIEKLYLDKRNSFGTLDWLEHCNEPSGAKLIESKINELVDAVNKLETMAKNTNTVLESLVEENNTHEKQIDKLQMKLEPEKCETPADPYAEQRKWIGKLCKFWFADAEHPTFGILDFVDAGPHPEPFHINCGESEQGWYPHCEPVKPDDDIIYKGE